MRARTSEASQNTPNQHVVSRTLLRRFTAATPANSQALLKLDLLHDPVRSRICGPGGSGKVRDFVPYASTSLEAYWSRIENAFPPAFTAVDDGSLFHKGNTHQLSAVRDLAALHFVRSTQVKRSHFEAFELAQAEQKEYWRHRSHELHRFYRHRTGLIADTPGAIDRILTLLLEGGVAQMMSGAMLREQMENLYLRIRTVLEAYNVQIWTAAPDAGEFLIGDAPAVLFSPQNGFPCEIADISRPGADLALILPLGPQCTAWLHRGPASGYQLATATDVEKANAVQILASEAHAFARPGTSFEIFAGQVRKYQGYPLTAQIVHAA
jgi:hypothetical protein